MRNCESERIKAEEERIRESGQASLGGGSRGRIHLISVIGEIEGHENLSGSIFFRSLQRQRTMMR